MAVTTTSSLEEGGILSVSRTAENLPQTTTTSYFTISSGDFSSPAIELVGVVGTADTAIGAVNTNFRLEHSTQGDMCGNLDIISDAQFTTYSITGAIATAMVDTAPSLMMGSTQLLFDGDIQATTDASTTGTTSWILYYRKLQPDALVVAV